MHSGSLRALGEKGWGYRLMTNFSGTTKGPVILDSEAEIRGVVDGDVLVAEKAKLVLYGTVSGDVKVEIGGKALIYGVVAGSVQNNGHVYVAGMVLKGIHNSANASSQLEKEAVVLGEGNIAARQ